MINCPLCDAICDDLTEKCDCGYIFKEKDGSIVKANFVSAQRYILNLVVRTVFFFGLAPILYLASYPSVPSIQDKSIFLLLPYGLIIFVVFGIIGAILDIVLPKRFLIGGRMAVWAFNFSTLTWFEGMEFNVSVNTGFGGKGVSIKDERE